MKKHTRGLAALLAILAISAMLIFTIGCQGGGSGGPTYSITIQDGIRNGSITANPTKSEAGKTVTLTALPDPGWMLKAGSVSVKDIDGKAVETSGSGNSRTFAMPASDVFVSAQFEVYREMFSINIPEMENGSITANPETATAGAQIRLTIRPAPSHQLKPGSLSIKDGDGAEIAATGSGNTRSFRMPASDVSVSAAFEDPSTTVYTVTVESTENGTITANPASGNRGASITLTISPNTNYQLKPGTLSVQDANGRAIAVNDTDNSFILPASNITVNGEFEPTYSISITPGPGGTVTTNPSPRAAAGASVSITGVATTDGQQLKTITVTNANGTVDVPVTGAGNARNFTMPDYDVSIGAITFDITFAIALSDTLTVTPPASGDVRLSQPWGFGGETITVTGRPNDPNRWQLKTIKAEDASGADIDITTVEDDAKLRINTCTFVMPTSKVTITELEFEYLANVDIQSNSYGTVTANPNRGTPGTDIRLTISPNFGYELDENTFEAREAVSNNLITLVPVNNSYTFTLGNEDVTVYANFVPEANRIGIVFEGPGDESIDFSGIYGTISMSGGDQLEASVQSPWNFDSFQWYLDGALQVGENNSFFTKTFDFSYIWDVGPHTLVVICTKGTAQYSKELTFRVVY